MLGLSGTFAWFSQLLLRRPGLAEMELALSVDREGEKWRKQGDLKCVRCGSDELVELRAYYVAFSLLLYSKMVLGAFRPICHSCKARGGLARSAASLLLGLWGFPGGTILTFRAIAKNLEGGVTETEAELYTGKTLRAPSEKLVSPQVRIARDAQNL